jgi:hypothetical protein
MTQTVCGGTAVPCSSTIHRMRQRDAGFVGFALLGRHGGGVCPPSGGGPDPGLAWGVGPDMGGSFSAGFLTSSSAVMVFSLLLLLAATRCWSRAGRAPGEPRRGPEGRILLTGWNILAFGWVVRLRVCQGWPILCPGGPAALFRRGGVLCGAVVPGRGGLSRVWT